MASDSVRLLSTLVAPFPGEPGLPTRVDAALALSVGEPELPPAVSRAIDVFLERGVTRDGCSTYRRPLSWNGFLPSGREDFVGLVARLASGGQLGPEDAARVLAAIPHGDREELPPPFRHLVEVADAVVEDAKDAFMAVDDDDLFSRAIKEALSEKSASS